MGTHYSTETITLHTPQTTNMPMVKLVYFDLEGRGELIRLLLHAGNIDYEDFRFGFADWPKHKPTTPFGSVPVLFWDGEEMAQTMAIARFVARKVGMAGNTDMVALDFLHAPEEMAFKDMENLKERRAVLDKYPLVKANYQRTCALPTSLSWKAKKPVFHGF